MAVFDGYLILVFLLPVIFFSKEILNSWKYLPIGLMSFYLLLIVTLASRKIRIFLEIARPVTENRGYFDIFTSGAVEEALKFLIAALFLNFLNLKSKHKYVSAFCLLICFYEIYFYHLPYWQLMQTYFSGNITDNIQEDLWYISPAVAAMFIARFLIHFKLLMWGLEAFKQNKFLVLIPIFLHGIFNSFAQIIKRMDAILIFKDFDYLLCMTLFVVIISSLKQCFKNVPSENMTSHKV